MTEFIPEGSRFHALASPFPMKRGGVLHGARVAYETWGTLDAQASNAILIVTGLSPDAHAASHAGNPAPGWWEPMLGPGKPIDTNRWFVVAADVVKALGITQLACLIGNSMGGMTALALLYQHPGIARSHINISGSAQALPFSIAIRSLQREAIRLDPAWNNGDYDEEHYPESGMRMARKLGVITYRSALEWDGRFGRVRLDSELADEDPFGMEFQVESYLEGHARRFVRRFDPNCYLYLGRSMDWFDLAEYAGGDVLAGLAKIHVERALAIGANTDILFPVEQQQQVADGLRAGGADARFIGMDSPQGHDAFLVDYDRFGPAVRDFLQSLPTTA
jgi:homoserine O-acetyltransferase